MTEFPPLGNPSILDVVTGTAFEVETCERLASALDPKLWRRACVAPPSGRLPASGLVREDERKVYEQPIPGPMISEILDTVMDLITIANGEHFRFDLTGFQKDDEPMILRYDGASRDFFVPHFDIAQRFSTRKLSFTVQLSPASGYEGGDLVFPVAPRVAARGQGDITIFPAWRTHLVEPVTCGERLALVGWVHGPTFR